MLKRFFDVSVASSLVLSVLLPTVAPLPKAVIFGAALFAAIIFIVQRHVPISKWAIGISLLFAGTGLIWSLSGCVAGNPGALRVLTVMVAYPLAFPVLALCYQSGDDQKLHRLFLLLGLSVGIFDLGFIVASLLDPDNFFTNFVFDLNRDDAVIDHAEDYFKFTVPNIASCIFLLPFLVVSFLNSRTWHWLTGSSIALLIVVAILSGRRALFLTPVLGVCLAYLLTRPAPDNIEQHRASGRVLKKLVMAILLLATLFLLNSVSEADFIWETIRSIIDFSANDSNRERMMQFRALLDGIDESPLFGHGAGAAAGYSRSDTQPWAYELSYLALIFQYGLVGFAVYVAGVALLMFVLIDDVNRIGRDSFQFPLLAGFLSFILANATNPYLGKFDYMWVMFIPYAFLYQYALRLPDKGCQ